MQNQLNEEASNGIYAGKIIKALHAGYLNNADKNIALSKKEFIQTYTSIL
jgi:hypothetical protein